MSSSLHAGTVLGSYRIVAPLGAGGMGEVYRAHDSKLDRPVAIKILPDQVVRDSERIRRFVQEAKSASALSHPNIVTIYEIGEATPRDEGTDEPSAGAPRHHYIAMELVEGSTLRQLLDDRSVEPRTLLVYLAQAAEGLAKAHGAGIVHRDLKPENIMVTRDGYAKILDFGLAKLTEPSVAGSALAAAPTALDEERTREGAVMGTVGYMSPEQAMGKPVDHRTDIFAFGCLLYEAVTGKKPFTGESSVDILHAIVRETPAPVETLAPTIPRALVRKIRRCLEKDPAKRAHSMKDLAFELHDLAEEWEALATSSGTVSSQSGLSGDTAPARAGIGRAGWIALAAGAAALVLALAILWRGRSAPVPPSASFPAMKLTAATSTGDVLEAALSPDGGYLLTRREVANGMRLTLRQLASGSEAELLAPQGAKLLRYLGFTPDGNFVSYALSDDQRSLFTLYRLPLLGGTPRRIVDDIDSPAAFSPDRRRIGFVRNSTPRQEQALLVANADGSGESPLATRRNAEGKMFAYGARAARPAWSPDGRTLVVVGADATGEFRGEIVAVDAAGGAEHRLGDTVWIVLTGLAWTPDGRSLIVAGTPQATARTSFKPQLWRLEVSNGTLSRITNDSQAYLGPSLSADGRVLASVQQSNSAALWRRSLGGAADERQLTFSNQEEVSRLRMPGDGGLYYSFGGSRFGIARIDPGGGEPYILTPLATAAQDVQASRDGKTLLYRTLLADGRVVLQTADREGANVREITSRGALGNFALHPDGTWFVLSDEQGLWRQPIDGSPPSSLVDRPAATPIAFSPDGTRFAYLDGAHTRDGAPQIVLVVIPANGGPPLARLERPDGRFSHPHWAPDGAAFTWRMQEGKGYNIFRQPVEGGPMERLTAFDGLQIWSYVLSPDGRTLFYAKGEESSDAVLIENF